MIIDFIGYKVLHHHIVTSHEKDTKILFYKIKSDTSDLLSKLLYQYSIQQDILKEKHKIVMKYLNSKNDILGINLYEIHKKINKDTLNNPYSIYITNKDLVIKNTTFKADLEFNLSFAKKTFDEHYKDKDKVIGCCSPLFEKSSKNFLSFTDSYILKNNEKVGVVQVSYNYPDTKQLFLKIQKVISQYPNIEDAKAYILVDTGFVNDLILKDFLPYKPTLKEIQDKIKDGINIKNKLTKTTLASNIFIKDDIQYKAIYLSTNSAIFDNTKIIYSILLNETSFKNDIKNLNFLMIILTMLGFVTIIIVTKIRDKETKLNEQDKFVQSSMHEIRTPLSVITLNNELRELEFGKDEYSQEIDSALKILQNSYDDMSFIVTANNINYTVEELYLKDILVSRIDYFKTISEASNKNITYFINSNCIVKISSIELTRLIDNNLSNAIKYSKRDSTISITLENNILTFHNTGKPIKDKKKIFKKYFRENNIVGGYGLGLSIVSDISKKYNISFDVNSNDANGTIFKYKFECHINDISQ